MRTLLLGALAAGALIAIAAESHRRTSLYWYDVEDDYAYAFDAAKRIPVEISRDGIELAAAEGNAGTVLLPISLASRLTGHWFEPFVELDCGDLGTSRQYFERGARGRRYLNLTCLSSRPWPERVRLEGHHLSWREQPSELLHFEEPSLDPSRILVLAPHPDDAEIAAFGLYAQRDSWIVTVTAGNYVDGLHEHLLPETADQNLLRGRLRSWDSVVIPLWGGVPPSRSVNLGYFNGSLAKMQATPQAIVSDDELGSADIEQFRSFNTSDLLEGSAFSSSWRSLVDDLTLVLRRTNPEIIVAPHPSLDVSSDHRSSTFALFEALDRVAEEEALAANTVLLLYSNHHFGAEYFPFGPHEASVTLGPWFDPELPLDGLFSYALDQPRQLDKLFALDAMHDLRAAPRPQGSGPIGRFTSRLLQFAFELWSDPTESYSYFRRATRPNEVFFTYPIDQREHLRDFATRRGAPVSRY